MQNLNLSKEYSGNQLLHVGNGQGLHITHTCLSTSYGSFLHLRDNNLTIEFVANMHFIKDKRKEVHLAQGIARGGLYKLLSKKYLVFSSCDLTYIPSSMLFIFNNSACSLYNTIKNKTCNQTTIPQCQDNTAKSTMTIYLLHKRFGHPNKHMLKFILFFFHFSFISSSYLCAWFLWCLSIGKDF